jgi:hypothetical protein
MGFLICAVGHVLTCRQSETELLIVLAQTRYSLIMFRLLLCERPQEGPTNRAPAYEV